MLLTCIFGVTKEEEEELGLRKVTDEAKPNDGGEGVDSEPFNGVPAQTDRSLMMGQRQTFESLRLLNPEDADIQSILSEDITNCRVYSQNCKNMMKNEVATISPQDTLNVMAAGARICDFIRNITRMRDNEEPNAINPEDHQLVVEAYESFIESLKCFVRITKTNDAKTQLMRERVIRAATIQQPTIQDVRRATGFLVVDDDEEEEEE